MYEITATLGAGGMGEVYRARDTKLNRDVAIKVLPDLFAADPERLARFEREAQSLAALNHPHIAQIFGVIESPAALVMECVDGEDLAHRIARGPLPLEEVLAIARQIADGLEAAHDRGIVHRDLKPANIKISPDGNVKILDFGLAKAVDPAGVPQPDAMNSPTLTMHATQMGVILGTAAYMAPEQARARAVDKRADIWAFGVVVYEMLAGRRLFEGEEASDVLAAVLRQELHFTALPPTTPGWLRRLLERCLERDPKQRLRDIGEARIEIAAAESGGFVDHMTAPRTPEKLPRSRHRWPWIGALMVVAIVIAATFAALRPRPLATSVQPVRLLARLDPNVAVTTTKSATLSIALSPDGATLAFSGTPSAGGGSQLYVRRLDQLTATAIAGTDGAHTPFFSPDGQWIAFFADEKLKKVLAAGGSVVTLCDAPNDRGATWTADNGIVFAARLGAGGLMRVDAGGGTPAVFTRPAPGMITQRWPDALPGGAGVLYTEHSDVTAFDGANLVVVSPRGATPKVVVHGGSNARFVPGRGTDTGYLVYLSQGRLVAVEFDLKRLETVGAAVPVVEGLAADSTSGAARFSVAANGTLVYVPGSARNQRNPIDWVAADGTVSALRATPADWKNPNFSPDGRNLAMDIFDGTQRDIYIYEWAADRLTQLTFDPSDEWAPVWSPDGSRIAFASDRGTKGVGNLYSRRADGTGTIERLTDNPADQRPGSFDPSGRRLVYEQNGPQAKREVLVLPVDSVTGRPSGAAVHFADAEPLSTSTAPSFSPDGRWIAMQGRGGAEVRSYPGPGGMWKVTVDDPTSMDGGVFPRWSPSGHQLFLLTGSAIFAAPYAAAGDEFRAGRPVRWSQAEYSLLGVRDVPYAIQPDGRRIAILANHAVIAPPAPEVVFVFRFSDGLASLLDRRDE